MKLVELERLDLTEYVREGDVVTWGQGSAEPVTLIERFVQQRHAIGGAKAFVGLSITDRFRPEHCDVIEPISYGALGTSGKLETAGKLKRIPCHYSAIPRYMRDGRLPIDVVFLQLSPPGPDGTHSLGFGGDLLPAAIDRARVVIAEINDAVPWSRMGQPVDLSKVAAAVEVSRPVPTLQPQAPGRVDRQIAQHIASVVRDGATLQYGVGAIPAAILQALSGHQDLGLHSGLITEDIIPLVESGVITNAQKPVYRGVSVGALVIGGARMRDFLHDNRAIEIHSIDITHGPATLGQIDNLVALNSALEVDLAGQVNAERIGDRYIGAIGGQVDFMHAASTAENGLSIIAMPATSGKSGQSRIVNKLGGPFITTCRTDVDLVVTEHGIADLRGKTDTERASALATIAAPEFRESLMASA